MAKKNKKKEESNFEVNETSKIGQNVSPEKENDASTGKEGIQNKPSEEEISNAKQEFEDAVNDFNSGKWQVGTEEDAERLSSYLVHFVYNRIFWYKDGWQGVLKFRDEIDETREKIKNGELKVLELTWQALEFIFHSLSNPGGIGLESAQRMKDENDDFVFCMEKVGESLQKARDRMNEIQFLQDKWATMQQGFYLEKEDGVAKDENEQISQQNENEIKKESKEEPKKENKKKKKK